MNREQRRAYNKQNKTNFTRDQFDILVSMNRLMNDQFEEAKANKTITHLDNEKIAPEGCAVKLNYQDIYKRPQEDLTEEFKNFVEENKDKELHLTREGTTNSLVSLVEDVRYAELDGKKVVKPKFLFDLYSDLLVSTESGFKDPFEAENMYKQKLYEERLKAEQNGENTSNLKGDIKDGE